MKKLTVWMLIFACVLMLSGCSELETLPRVNAVCGGDPRMLILDCEDGDYGVILSAETEVNFKEDLCEEAWEEVFSIYGADGKWGVVDGFNLYVSVILGEKTETPENRDYDYTKGWYYAEKITVERFTSRPYSNEKMKPVIYLYPEIVTDVEIFLDNDGELTCTYPKYEDGWHVTAQPDGTLTDATGKTYNYLYWEGKSQTEYDFSKGFCVSGEETAAFLEDALAKLGLNRREANEFIVYWLPMMVQNPYNFITFQTNAYTESARLDITPKPDTMIRVFMAWKPLEEEIEVEPQTLYAPERNGFTVVEWGGSKVEE